MASTERERASRPQKRRMTRKKIGRYTVNIRAESTVKRKEVYGERGEMQGKGEIEKGREKEFE